MRSYFNEPNPVATDPAVTRCHGCNSMILPRHPTMHCPKCHRTWQARSLFYPANCPGCDYNLRVWRQQNGIEEIVPWQGTPLPTPAKAARRQTPKPKAKAAPTRRKPGPKPRAA